MLGTSSHSHCTIAFFFASLSVTAAFPLIAASVMVLLQVRSRCWRDDFRSGGVAGAKRFHENLGQLLRAELGHHFRDLWPIVQPGVDLVSDLVRFLDQRV